MELRRLAAALALAALAAGCGAGPEARDLDAGAPGPALTRVALGSCAKQDDPQPIWDRIIAWRPELFLFLGDTVYADTDDEAEMLAAYAALSAQPGWQRMRTTCPIVATWDDHEYGENDADGTFPFKETAERLFLDFFEVPPDDPRRGRPGVYEAWTFGPPGRAVQVILLDLRFFRSPFGRRARTAAEEEAGIGPWGASDDPAATMLGDAQWRWLEDRLREPADVRIIGSSVQVIASEHGWESWGHLPTERRRLFDLIGATGADGVVLVSGDTHWGAISRTDEGPYPLWELTASALNQSWPQAVNMPNPRRLDGPYPDENFGTIEVDWDAATVRLGLIDLEGREVFARTIALEQLRAKEKQR